MIDVHQHRAYTSRRLWSGTIQTLFQALDLESRASTPAISEGLALFCQENPRVSGTSLSLLMARSFCVAGDSEAAGRVLHHDPAHRRHAEAWLSVLAVHYPFPELYPLFSARALRPVDLHSAGRIWVLDFDAVHLSDADRHELILFQTVRVLAEKVSNVWKKTKGRGTLGVKGLGEVARFMRSRRTPDQLFDHIHDVLARCAKEQGWDHVPSLLQIDL